MITFTFTPVGGIAATTVTLLDSDRFWPSSIDIGAIGEAQVVMPARGLVKTVLGRGLKNFELTFPATREHANVFAAAQYCLQTIPAMTGALGNLTIAFPSGGSLRALNCVCRSAQGRNGGVRSYVTFSFVGPSIGP